MRIPSRFNLACVALSLSLAGCLGPGGSTYFPVTQGMQWTYAVNTDMPDGVSQSTLSIQGIGRADVFNAKGESQNAQVRRTSHGTDYYIVTKPEGVYRVAKRLVVETQGQTDRTPRLVLPTGKNLRVGYSWTQESTPLAVRWMPPFSEMNASIKPFDMVYTIESLDETLDTPAGRFEKCVKVEGQGRMTIYADPRAGYEEVFITHTEWYAPGVGLVKVERDEPLDTSIIKGGRVTLQLTAFQD